MSEHWWNDTDKRKSKYTDKNLDKGHFVDHKSHTNWPGIEPVPPR